VITLTKENETEFKKRIISILHKCEGVDYPEDYYKHLEELSQSLRKEESYLFLQKIFEVLGNFDRLAIINSIKKKDRCSCEFEAILQKSQPAISRDLKRLEDVNLIQGWKKGKFIHYSLVKTTFNLFNQILENWFSAFENWFEELFDS
jgi:ArsR family transcriptional regulator